MNYSISGSANPNIINWVWLSVKLSRPDLPCQNFCKSRVMDKNSELPLFLDIEVLNTKENKPQLVSVPKMSSVIQPF